MTATNLLDTPPLDASERGARGQRSDRRLFMQLQVFGQSSDADTLIAGLERAGVEAVLYADAHDPFGIGLLTWSEDPAYFTGDFRKMLRADPFAHLVRKPEFTLFGRIYALGYEADLEETLIARPRARALNPDWPWTIWYPLRRSGAFARLDEEEQKRVLSEHGTIGMRFGEADLGHDIRLASFGLDTNDNDFVIGLLGRELAPLSLLVQTMRKTVQTSMYIEKLGPFFVGRVLWQTGA